MTELISTDERVCELLDEKNFSSIKEIVSSMPSAEIIALFERIDEKQVPVIFRLLPKDLAAEVFIEMDSDFQELLIKNFSDNELKAILDELYANDTADLVEEMPANVVKRILNQIDPSMRNDVNQLLQYPENSAGSIMTTEYIALRLGTTVGEAISKIREYGLNQKSFYSCYVTKNKKLIGRISLKDLVLAKDDSIKIDEIIKTNVISVKTNEDKEEVAKLLSKYNFYAIPVVDGENRMVGIISFDDALEVMEDEATEDIEIMAAMTPSQKTYLRSSPFDLFKHRIVWLLLLMVSATFTGMIITNFEHALAAQVILTAFIPMLMDTGGNTGSQSSVTIIRALSLGEIEFRDLPKVLLKEFCTAFLCALCLFAACFLKIFLIDYLLLGNEDVTYSINLVVCLTVAFTVVIAKLIGCTLPLLAKKLTLDPAVMASPFITTIVDAVSLIVYFTIAKTFLF
ncbi:magnesium transporter [Treponema pectinovorum]|uniref:magnesium transporter n=1 Tax=Treponema pectinovorum TaxID=164 RepID=UPI00164EAD33|nr:magnesium transporter [Treponema pectinovorum]